MNCTCTAVTVETICADFLVQQKHKTVEIDKTLNVYGRWDWMDWLETLHV